jgi:uncharacterized protein (TIGR03435 family)
MSMSKSELRASFGVWRMARLRRAEQRAVTIATVVAVGLVPQTAAVWGDAQDAKPASDLAFEVVSVKAAGKLESIPLGDGKWGLNTKPFRYTEQWVTAVQTLGSIIQQAYSLQDWELTGPRWINELIYEVSAKMPPSTSRATARLMLQTMLAERFAFKFHRENRKIPAYALVVGNQGFKLLEAADPGAGFLRAHFGEFVATGTLDQMVYYLMNYADKPVVNMTGIKGEGRYHIELRWTPEDTKDISSRYDPLFWKAMERVVVLKLEKRDLSCDIIVVDYVKREPTQN